MTTIRLGAALILSESADRKLATVVRIPNGRVGPFNYALRTKSPLVAATYVSIEDTCPDSCSFKGNGCYAQTGITSRAVRKLDAAARKSKNLEESSVPTCAPKSRHTQTDEAEAIGMLYVKGVPDARPLRLHVAGDVKDELGARLLAAAAQAWLDRGGGPVWTYTRRWDEVARDAWGPIQVLASVRTWDEFNAALARGYVPALTLLELPSDRAFKAKGRRARGWRVVPCPYETRGTTCVKCRLCVERDLHGLRVAIAFEEHGAKARKKRRLAVMGAT